MLRGENRAVACSGSERESTSRWQQDMALLFNSLRFRFAHQTYLDPLQLVVPSGLFKSVQSIPSFLIDGDLTAYLVVGCVKRGMYWRLLIERKKGGNKLLLASVRFYTYALSSVLLVVSPVHLFFRHLSVKPFKCYIFAFIGHNSFPN